MGGQYNICSAINCTNSRKRISNLPMFRVPKDPVRSKEWITNSGRKELLLKDPNYLYDNIRFCAFHFKDSQFTNSNKNRLIWNAVPTLFSEASDVGLDQTKLIDYQSLVNHVETERKTNRTFIVLKRLCLPKQKSLKRDFKPTVLREKLKALRQIACQSPTKYIDAKGATNTTVKVELVNKFVSQRSECQLSVKRTGNRRISNPTKEVKTKLGSSENSSLIILNSDTLEYKNKVDAFKRKLFTQKNNSINKTSKPENFKKKCKALQANECNSSANCIETKDTKIPSDGVDILENALGQSLANHIEAKRTKNITNEVDMQEKKCQYSVNHIEIKETSNISNEVDMQENEGQSSINCIVTNGTTNTTDEVNIQENEGQSSTNRIKTKRTTNHTDKADIQENKCQSSANHSDTNNTDEVNIREIEIQYSAHHCETKRTCADKAGIEENKGQSSANRMDTKRTANATDEAVVQKKYGQSSVNHIETNEITNTTDEVNIQENEGQSSANHIETKGTAYHTDKADIQENKGQSSTNHNETKESANTTTDEVNIREREGQSSANHMETEGTTNHTDKADKQENKSQSSVNHKGIASTTDEVNLRENEGQSPENHIESKKTTNSTYEVDTQTKSGSQVNDYESPVLLSSVKQIDNKRISNPTDKLHIKLHSPGKNSLILNCDLSQNKRKIKAIKRKTSLLKNSYGKRKHVPTPAVLAKKFEALKENECQSPAKSTETKNTIIHTEEVDIQENSCPKIDESYSLLKNSKTESITKNTDKVLQSKLGQQRNECQSSILLSSVKQKKNKRISDCTENVQTILSSLGSSNSLLINDDFSQYKKRVEAFKKKLCSPNFIAVNRTFKRKSEAPKGIECESSVGLKQTESKNNIKSGIGDAPIKTDPRKIVCTPSVNYFETKRILNPIHKIQTKRIPPENHSLITNGEVTKYKKKVEACEKIMDRLKTDHKAEVTKLRKVIKELRRRTNRKDFLISKLRKERKELKDGSYFVRPNSKPNFQRDRHLIEKILSKYVSRDALNIVMSQIRRPTTNFGNRWDDEVKMFALNIFQSSPKAYRILCSYLHLPSTRTLQKFVQGADLMALSGLNYKISSDVAGDNEDGDTVPENSSVDADNEDVTDPEFISSVVEVESEDVFLPECLLSQSNGNENEGQIICVVTDTDKECEVITEGWIPDQDSKL